MAPQFDRPLRDLLRAAGCSLVPQGKGSHEIWHSPITKRNFAVPVSYQAVTPPTQFFVRLVYQRRSDAFARSKDGCLFQTSYSGTTAAVFSIAFCSLASADPLNTKRNRAPAPQPEQAAPPPFHYIHCAMVVGDSPCAMDPAMRQLDGLPPDDNTPRLVPVPDQPSFMPAR
jgi:hypothetical protein